MNKNKSIKSKWKIIFGFFIVLVTVVAVAKVVNAPVIENIFHKDPIQIETTVWGISGPGSNGQHKETETKYYPVDSDIIKIKNLTIKIVSVGDDKIVISVPKKGTGLPEDICVKKYVDVSNPEWDKIAGIYEIKKGESLKMITCTEGAGVIYKVTYN